MEDNYSLDSNYSSKKSNIKSHSFVCCSVNVMYQDMITQYQKINCYDVDTPNTCVSVCVLVCMCLPLSVVISMCMHVCVTCVSVCLHAHFHVSVCVC